MCVLVKLEVSQKQAYIFGSNQLKENVRRSELIDYITGGSYFKEQLKGEFPFKDENIFYSGGGHIVCQFSEEEQARRFVGCVTKQILRDIPDMEVFVKIWKMDEGKSVADNLFILSQELEKKKSWRRSFFHQGSFGVEKVSSTTLDVIQKETDGFREVDKCVENLVKKRDTVAVTGNQPVYYLDDLGATKDDESFISVIHIDGNGMGKRVENFRKAHGADCPLETYQREMKEFSDKIDQDFKAAYYAMVKTIEKNKNAKKLERLSLGEVYLPIRRLILAGDDVCFVTDARIGLECAAIFLEELKKKGYYACAGIAIVHLKYPFYRAYELAEQLCSSAKKVAARLGEASVMDWHVEQGEIVGDLEEIRGRYQAGDGSSMILRPYVVLASDEANQKEETQSRSYARFCQVMRIFQRKENAYARGKLKEAREIIQKGESEMHYYIQKNLLQDLTLEAYQGIHKVEKSEEILFRGEGLERESYITIEEKKYSLWFDAIEMMDLYIELTH